MEQKKQNMTNLYGSVTDVNKMFMCQSKTADDDCNIELVNGTPTCTNHSNSTKMAGKLSQLIGGKNLTVI